MYANRKQQGVVLLTLMLVIVATGSFVLLKALNVAVKNADYEKSVTRAALADAKLALIGYAVGYPDRPGVTDANKGPGRLPCPDFQFDDTSFDPVIGSMNACSRASRTETGLFPWYTVGTNELLDASGSRLWYAVSDVFRYNASGVVNSDTVDTSTPVPVPMRVDGSADEIVAVIIAPGAALSSQTRGTSLADIYDPTKYLEDENASRGDNLFTENGSGEFNDELVTITRQELMAAVQHRVLRDVKTALNQFHADPSNDAYPWLRAFGDPENIAVAGSTPDPLTVEGHVPIHKTGDDFDASFEFSWNIVGGTLVTSGVTPPPSYCVQRNDCLDNGYGSAGPTVVKGTLDPGIWEQGSCVWIATDHIECTAIEVSPPGSGGIKRTYEISISGIDPTTIDPPTATSDRIKNFNLTTIATGGIVTITITDDNGGPSSVELTASDSSTLTDFALTGVPFYLATYDHTDPSATRTPGDLPQWFTANDWHRQLVVAYTPLESPGVTGTGCTVGTNCLELEWDRNGSLADVVIDNLPGVAILAGPNLGGSRPSTLVNDYFEGANRINEAVIPRFAKGPASVGFNDQIIILDPND